VRVQQLNLGHQSRALQSKRRARPNPPATANDSDFHDLEARGQARSVWSAWSLLPLPMAFDVQQREQAPRTPNASRDSIAALPRWAHLWFLSSVVAIICAVIACTSASASAS